MVQPAEVDVLIPHLALMPNATVITDCGGLVRWANDACNSLTGYSSEELAGRNVSILEGGDAASELGTVLQRVVATGKPWKGEAAGKSKGGQLYDLELTITPVIDREGGVTHALWTLQDSTDRKLAFDRLEQLQKVVSAAPSAAQFGVFKWDAKTGKSEWSPEASRLYGLNPDTTEPSFDAWLATVHSGDRERVLHEFRQTLDGIETEGMFNIEYRSTDGLRWIAGHAQLYRDSEGKPDHMVGINIDITKHKLADLALSRQADLTERIFNSTDAHLAVVDADGRILEVNEAWSRFARENNAGDERNWGRGATYFRDCTPAGDIESAAAAFDGLRRVQLGKLPHFELEYTCHAPDEDRWFTMGVVPFHGRPGTVLVSHRNTTERKRMEHALRESEERYRRVSSVISDVAYGCWATETGTYAIDWLTGATERITGYSRDELKAMGCWGLLVLDEDRALFDEHVAGLTPNSSGFCELRVRHKDGSVRWLASSAECIQAAGPPAVKRIYGGLVDITERKVAEAALLDSERLLRESQLVAGLGSYVLEIPTGLWTSSAVLDQMFGTDETYIHSVEGWLGLIHPEDRGMMADHFQNEVLGQRRKFDKEYRILRQDNQEERWVHGHGRLEFDAADCPARMYGTIQDVTERKRAETALREIEVRYRAIFESSRDALFVADAQSGMLVDANPAAQALIGRSLEEIQKLHQTQLHPPEDELVARSNFERDRIKPTVTLHRVVRWDGKRIPVEISGNLMHDQSGRELILGAFRDITDRVRAEEERERLSAQLIHAQKMESVGRLAGGVAHDFNNLLTVINGHCHLLLMNLDPGDERRPNLEAILNAGERAGGLTQQLLAFSRKQVLQPHILDLNQVVSEMPSMLSRLVGEDIEVQVELKAKAATVSADPHQLQHVLMNLVVNARDAMPGGGKVLIETAGVEWDERCIHAHPGARVGRYVMLAVTDDGAGMDADTRQKIFEPFFTTKGVGKGTGLGLSMVHGIVVQSGGLIEVESEPGCGTSIRIFLPQVEEAQTVDEVAVAPPSIGGSELVLVVEDQPEVLNFAVRVLKRYGYRVVEADDVGRALQLFQQQAGSVDLVLTDVVMPNGSGRELAVELEKLQPGIKVIFMSGYTDDVIVRHLVRDEGVDFIQKPFGPEQLAAKIRAVLGR